MAQQTFAGVPSEFTAGEVLSSSDQNLLRNYLIAQIKEGMTGDTGEILPMIMDLTNNRIILDAGGLEFSNGSLQTVAASAIGFSGTTANGMLTYSSASTIATESTATYDGTTLQLTASGGGLKLDNLDSSNVNTLDDYEEGTFTAAFSASSGTITILASHVTGYYIKVGKLVHVQLHTAVGSVSSPSGAVYLEGLPFTSLTGLASSAQYNHLHILVGYLSSGNTYGTSGQLPNNSTQVSMTEFDGGTTATSMAAKFAANTEVHLTGTYVANV